MEYTGTLTIVTCPHRECGMTYAIPNTLYNQSRHDHKSIYCPLGHGWHYTGESDLEKANRLRRDAEARLRNAQASRQAAWDQAAAAERSARAYRGHLTRMKNQIANGVCPVNKCRRHFDSVQAHIATMHPEWAAKNPEALA